MTSRPPLAVSQRQPQRTLSASGLSQRPGHPRTLTQPYPQSPIRRSENFNEQSSDVVADLAQARFGTTPRRGGSRLKLELANDGITHAGFSESPQNLDPISANKVFTPSRVMSMNDASDLGDMSPHTSRCQTVEGESAPLPMPPRRAQFAMPTKRPQPPNVSAPPKKDSRSKPFSLEPPPDAPRYSNMGKQEPSGYADFTPWRGGHAEDQFNADIIKVGFFDKPPAQPSQEAASAKNPLFPALKHKSGLHTLSTIFTNILSSRRHSGLITSSSTFKPPPRVTLTDTKRELWLKDLANPAISLRRLSRTIPHGIRGRVLLDQSLNKNVPTDRAVWLAKCVGANEIRAFKRKGLNNTFTIGGEVKWIRDWTSCVAQFVDNVASAFNDKNWKAKITYAIRLATHLYAEHLLDRDYYIDWLISSLENSNQAKLPLWILIIQIYWRDILKFRRHGRRLVAAILTHHCAVYTHPDRDILLPLSSQLSTLVELLVSNSPESFVHPITWAKFSTPLQSSLANSSDSKHISLFKLIDKRNDNLTRSHVKSQPAVRSTLVGMLDDMLRMPFRDDLLTQLHRTVDDHSVLIRTVLEWCTSLYRFGTAKVYGAATILRSLTNLDVDITRDILEFLGSDPMPEKPRKQVVYQLVSELVRSGHFSVPQYAQWLIARGSLFASAESLPDGPCITRLLVEIPTGTLNESMRGLRASLLRRTDYLVEDEAVDIATAISCVKRTLSVPLDPWDPILQRKPMSAKKVAKLIELSSRALKSEVSSWLCNEFVCDQSQTVGKGGVELLTMFETVRLYLEAAQDFAMLEGVVKHMVRSSSAELLAACGDTVNLHLPVFAAMGSAKELFHSFYERLKAISEEQGIGARPLLASLANLAPRLPGCAQMACQLQNDLIRADRSSAVDASSPLSDNMATQLQDAESQLSDQIEKLASYTSADRSAMERLFHTIGGKLKGCWGKTDDRQRPYCLLLARLRVFDTQYFDTLMRDWVQYIRKSATRPAVTQIFPPLMSSGCLSLEILFATAPRNQANSGQLQQNLVGSASTYMQEALQMLMLPFTANHVMTSEDCYRFRIIQEQARLEHAKDVMPLIRGALAEYAASRNQQTPRAQPLDDDNFKTHLRELLRDLILVDPNAASQTLSLKSSDTKLATLIEALTTKLLVPHGGGAQKTFEQVLELANEFTLPFCQVKLSLNLAIHDPNSQEGAERLQSQLEQLSRAMDNAIEVNNVMWTGMLPCLSPDITQHLRTRAEARFLELFPSFRYASSVDGNLNDRLPMAENLFAVIDSIFRGGSASRTLPLSHAMVDRLADLWEIVAAQNEEVAEVKAAVLSHWLPLLLSYFALQASHALSAADLSKLPGTEARARALIVLAGLLQEMDCYPSYNLNERIFDIALVLADNMPDDVRLHCVRAVKDHTSDPRIRYLFSFGPNPAENLMLAHREKPPPGAGIQERRAAMAMNLGMLGPFPERLTPFVFRRWEILNEPTPNIGENDTSLSLTLFDARKI
ncbi:transcription mediator subunit Med12 [Xylariomycetidae sp. FL0641]|nr:transcription mediator subunit Med12 [Xylariomycetidae sp. FL0641]